MSHVQIHPPGAVPTSATVRRGLLVCLIALALLAGCGQAVQPGADDTAAPDHASTTGPAPAEDDEDQDGSTAAPDPRDRGTDSPATPGGPTTARPAPGGGDIHTEVSVTDQDHLPAVDLDTATRVGEVARVEVLDVVGADVEARTAGEISGPGVVITAVLANESDTNLDLALVTVNAEDAAGLPLNPMSGAPADPFFGPLPPGSKAEATYVFGLPTGAEAPYTITINPAPEAAVAVFVGDPS